MMTASEPIAGTSPLAALRAALRQTGVQACLIPSADPHLSEYLPEYWQLRR